jgi:hypothetical protein
MSEQRLSAWNGCKYQDGTGAVTGDITYSFIPNEDTVVSTLTGSDGVNYLTVIGISGKTLKQGTLITAPLGVLFSSITLASGSIVKYK